MKPARIAFAILVSLCGVAFAGPNDAAEAYALLFFAMDFLGAVIASLILSVAAIALWRKEKKGSLKKRLAEISVPVAAINSMLAISCAIAFAIISLGLGQVIGDIEGGAIIAGLALILAPLLIAVYLCRKYYAETSGWNSLIAALLFTPLMMAVLALLSSLIFVVAPATASGIGAFIQEATGGCGLLGCR
ncbi:MAG: hypothetical protein PHV13_02495 [Candidatus ainarchaeum sp.]|nr:hypothetical protein [Candidatus ainarchaeum sp.]